MQVDVMIEMLRPILRCDDAVAEYETKAQTPIASICRGLVVQHAVGLVVEL